MRLSELMSTGVVTIESAQSASAAWSCMGKHRIRHLVVTDNGVLAGVISERDLGGRSGEGIRKGRTVQELMSSYVVSAKPAMTLRQAANLMLGRQIGSLPVIEDDRLVGIVTATDVLDELGRGSSRPTRRPEHRTLRMTESRKQAARRRVVHRQAPLNGPVGRARPRTPDSVRRSPFPGWVPKANRRDTGPGNTQIAAHIRTPTGDLGPDDRVYIRRKLGTRLGKFADSIARVSVRTEDVNGPRGGIDQVCRIKVVLRGLPSVVFERRDASLNAAVDGALAGAERSVRRALQRRRMKPLKHAV
jgi:CBS domain-containing protein/ribosome-associated translation inhibitor RaiA